MVLIFNFRKGKDFSVIEGQAPNTVKFTGAFLILGKWKVSHSKTLQGSLAPPVSPLPFERPVSKRFCKILVFSCLCRSSYQGSEDNTSPYWPAWPPLRLPSTPAHGPRAPFQLSLGPSVPAPVTLQLASHSPVGLELFGFTGFTLALLDSLPSPDAHRMLIAPVPITTLRCSSSQAPWGAPCPRGHRPACVAAAPGSPTLREQPCFCCSLTALAVPGDV